jgi:hypothetical protein
MKINVVDGLTFTSIFWCVLWTILFIWIPGNVIFRSLNLPKESLGIRQTSSFILGYQFLYLIAYGTFLLDWDKLALVYGLVCLVIFLWRFHELKLLIIKFFKKAQTPSFSHPALLLFPFLIGSFLLFKLNQQGILFWDPKTNSYLFKSHWDDLNQITKILELKNSFLPRDHPLFPGEPPFDYHWLGNIAIIYWVKFLPIDLLTAYYHLGPVWYYLITAIIVYSLFRLVKAPRLTSCFGTAIFCLLPTVWSSNINFWGIVGYFPNRGMAGLFQTLCFLFFAFQFIKTKCSKYFLLTFCWSFIYVTKANILLATFLGILFFYIASIFLWKNRHTKLFLIGNFILGGFFSACLLWIHKANFVGSYLPDFFNHNIHSWLTRGTEIFLGLLPALLIHLLWFIKSRKNIGACSQYTQLLAWIFFGTFLAQTVLAYHIRVHSIVFLYLGIYSLLPLALKELLPSHETFKLVCASLILAFFSASAFFQTYNSKAILANTPLGNEELALIKYLKNRTPPDSTVLYNVPRYIDRPAIMSALSQRKNFLNMAELLQATYEISLEERIYDYWDFLLCKCKEQEQKLFFDKYPNLNYLAIYPEGFSKTMDGFNGQSETAFAVSFNSKKSNFLKPVWNKNGFTIYKVHREPISY